jgi:hypothetical protein
MTDRKERTSPAASIAAYSLRALDVPLDVPAQLVVTEASESAHLVGAFEPWAGLLGGEEPAFRRGTGGATVTLRPGDVYLALTLREPSALVPCDPSKLLNRYLRPLLAALSSFGVKAAYFGRDWISAGKRPVAAVAFAYDEESRRCLVEAFVGVAAPFAASPWPSFMGAAAASLDAITGKTLESAAVVQAIASAYEKAYGLGATWAVPGVAGVLSPEPSYLAAVPEGMGPVGLRRLDGRMRVAGIFMSSRDAVRRLDASLATLRADASPALVGGVVDAAFGSPEAALFGVRSLGSFRDAILAAMAATTAAPPPPP